MKNLVSKIRELFTNGDNKFYLSLIGPFLMGTIHLVFVIIKFDWILLNYCIFSYLMGLFKLWQWYIEKHHKKPHPYVAAVISMLVILAPMMAAFVLTIRYKETPHYFVDWLIYAYALYGTIKMVFAVKELSKKNKNERQTVLSYLGIISALYTIQMMEFALIKTFSENGEEYAMYLMQLFSQGAIFSFSIFVIGIFIKKTVSIKKVQEIQ